VQIPRSLDVLANEVLWQELKGYSSCPTFPQIYIDDEFFAGCDIAVGILLYIFLLHSKMLEPGNSVRFLLSSGSHDIGI